ncbi:hypothetical protein [Acetobacterium carbinolicum]|uniref:hypothetical protein n=1 Tax=Acetobacterium carbinolicum TaxID=52690 RepID=UPI0039C9F43F
MDIKIRKRYVDVDVHFGEDGSIKPTLIYWHDGRKFMIDRVMDIRPGASRRAGGQGIRYLCMIMGVETVVFFEGVSGRWFVEEKVQS